MKTAAHARRSSAKPGPAQAAAPRVQTKARPGGAANHLRQGRDSLERQADEIASRIMRGEKNLARRITPTAAAGFHATGSNGAPLPCMLREEMESDFGADFRAVRIHTGSAADTATHEHAANAFASGRDIYFRSGLYAPQTPAGRELLAHELTHVLQQTGLPGSGGTVRATVRHGSGGVQCEGEHADDKIAFLASDASAWEEISKRHLARPDADNSLRQLAAAISAQGAKTLPRASDSTVGSWLVKVAGDGRFDDPSASGQTLDLTSVSKGLLVDCLKVCGLGKHFTAAVALLEADTLHEIQVAFGARQSFRDFLARDPYGAAWAEKTFDHPEIKKMWPWVFRHTFAQYFFAPARIRQGLYELPKAKANPALIGNLNAGQSKLMVNDRVQVGFAQIEEYERRKQDILIRSEKQILDVTADADEATQHPAQLRWQVALAARIELDQELLTPHPPAWKSMLGQMRATAHDATVFWEGLTVRGNLLDTALGEGGYKALVSGPVALSQAFDGKVQALQPLHAALVATGSAGGFFGLDATGLATALPDPVDYQKRITDFDKMLGLASNTPGNILLALQEALVALALNSKANSEEAKAVGWAIYALLDFKKTLFAYDAGADNRAYTDKRQFHRREVAKFLVKTGQIFQWADVITAGANILRGEDAQASYLIVTEPWWSMDLVPIADLTQDFSPTEEFVSVPLTAGELAWFFHGSFLRSMQAAVQSAVDAVNADPKAALDAKAVNEKVLALGRPWRCEPIAPTTVISPADAATVDADALISKNAWSLAELQRLAGEKNLGPNWVRLARKRGGGDAARALEIFAWIIPDFRPLVRDLQKTEPFKTRMAQANAPTEEVAWLKALLATTNAAGATTHEEIVGSLKTSAQQSSTDLVVSLRQFTAINRRKLAAAAKAKLQVFAAKRDVTNFTIPGEVTDATIGFMTSVAPDFDEQRQVGLLLLELGPDLKAAFPEARHAARIQPYFLGIIDYALAFADEATAASASSKPEDRQLYEPLLYSNPKNATENEKIATFLANRGDLVIVRKNMEDAMKQLQQLFGFMSQDGVTLQSVLIGPMLDPTPLRMLNPFRDTSVINDPRIEPGEKHAMEIDGDDWELVQVHQKFFYRPALTTAAAASETANPILVNEKEEAIPDGTPLLTFLINGSEEITIRAGAAADARLTRLSDAVFNHTLVQRLEHMGAAIEEEMTLMMDLVELIPGIGQEIAAKRALAMTLGSIASGEMDALIDQVTGDPETFIKELATSLFTKFLTVEGIITYVVLNQGPDLLKDHRKPSTAKRISKTVPRGNLARLIALTRRLGKRVADTVTWTQMRLAAPLRAVQSTVATRPKVGWMLTRAIDVSQWVASLIPPDVGTNAATPEQRREAVLADLAPGEIETKPENLTAAEQGKIEAQLGTIEASVRASGEEFKQQLEDLVNSMAEAQLPEEVVPNSLLVGIIYDFLLSRLGMKVKVLKKVLDATGGSQKIKDALGEKINDTAADPNRYWRELILDKLDAQFLTVRNDVVAGIHGITSTLAQETGLSMFDLGPPSVKDASGFHVQRTPFPAHELEPKERSPGSTRGKVAPPLSFAGGQTLPTDLRARTERHFGHDFRHVRLHTEPAAAEILKAVDADGLTSGSHVFLRGESLASPARGERLLKHELTHVLQQTGSRPLGENHSPIPLPGRPGLGIRVNAQREAEADRAAAAPASAGSLPVSGAAEGVQPDLIGTDTLANVVKTFTAFHSIAEFTKPSAGKTVPGHEIATNAYAAILRYLERKDALKFEPFLSKVSTDVLQHLKRIDFSADVQGAAALAQKPKKGAKGRAPKTELDFAKFITLLEAVIMGRSGVVLQIKMTETPLAVQSIHVTYLHLGFVAPTPVGQVPLWDKVMLTPGLVGSDKADKVRMGVFIRLQTLGPDPFVWNTSGIEYRFSAEFVEKFHKVVHVSSRAEMEKKLPVVGSPPPAEGDVPAADEYLNPSGQDRIGLLIGTHKNQKGTDRESHHTTQYLLVQFFRNHNSIKAWQPRKNYPGIKPATGNDRESFGTSTSTTLGLKELDNDSARGGAMPAILLASDTHRRGQLHVEKETRWSGDAVNPDGDPNQGRATQGLAIQATFRRELYKQFKAYDTAPDWNTTAAQAPDAEQKLHAAMLGTCKWMRGIMRPSLERGLKTRELAYYRELAARNPAHVEDSKTGKLKAAYDLKADQMAAVYNRAVANDNSVMGAKGWKAT